MKEIPFEVHKKIENLNLLEIKGDTNQEENVILTLIFDRNIKGNDFSNFYLLNDLNDTFNIPFKIINEDKSSLIINFNFDLIIEGKYHLNFIYKKNLYNNYKKNINIINQNKDDRHILTNVIYQFRAGKKEQRDYFF